MPKPVWWVGSSRDDLRAFPDDARRRAGYELRRVQEGLEPSDFKPLVGVGTGVLELRIHTDQEHRVAYVARLSEAIYVLHCFEKRSRKTAPADLELVRVRYRALLTWRRQKEDR